MPGAVPFEGRAAFAIAAPLSPGTTQQRPMIGANAEVDTVEEFAYALEYLVRLVGADNAVHLAGIARALHTVSWALPPLELVTPELKVYGYRTCLAERACDFLASVPGPTPPFAEALLDPIPSKPAIRKMCIVHYKAKLTPGFRFLAARDNNGTAAYAPNDLIPENAACGLLKNGWRCLHVRI